MSETIVESGPPDAIAAAVKKKPAPPARRRWWHWIVPGLAWGYLGLILAVLGLLRFAGDRWWPATLLTFGPRWVALIPLPLVSILALAFHRRALVPIVVAALAAVGPVMGYSVPWRTWVAGSHAPDVSRRIRVLSLNIGGGTKMEALGEFIREIDPDFIIFVEWGGARDIPAVIGEGWNYPKHAGVQIISRFPVVDVKRLRSPRFERWNHPAFRSDFETPAGIVHVIGLHLETPREGLEEVLMSRWKGAEEMERTTAIRRVESELSSQFAAEAGEGTIVAGDFNMPVDSAIYQQYWSGWQNAFSVAGSGFGYTKFTNRFGIRIDQVLADADWRVIQAEVGPSLGGDHRPLVVDLERR